MKKQVLYLLIGFWTCLPGYSQKLSEKGVPLLKNYVPEQYNEQGKIWAIRSAANGMVYMAADQGLLEYDGNTWRSYKGSTGFTRSILLTNDSVIYTGSDLDFGIWTKNRYQAFEYTSLYPFQKDLNEVYEEFWAVHQIDDNVLFISSQNIYVYRNQQLTRIPAPNRYEGSYLLNDTLYISDRKNGLFILSGLTLKQLCTNPEGRYIQIAGVCRNKGELVIVTRNLGLYTCAEGVLTAQDNELSARLESSKVFSFEQIGDNHLAFGTVLGGVFIVDSDGRIIHHINKQKGLANNTILSLHFSSAGRLWIGMDYGISSINLRSDVNYFIDYRGDFGTGSSAILKDDVFYLGTNQGLYRSDWKGLNNDSEFYKFDIVPGTEGQVWSLLNIDNTLLIGHDKGLLLWTGTKVRTLSTQPGVWTMLPCREYLLTGNYNGISIFSKGKTGWEYIRRMEQILGSCNQMVLEGDNILWVNIPNFGIIRAVLDNDLYPVERLIFPVLDFQGNNPSLKHDSAGIFIITDRFEYFYDAGKKEFIQKTERRTQPRAEGVLRGIYYPLALNSDYGFYPVYNGFALRYLAIDHKDFQEKHFVILRDIEAFNNHERIKFYPGALIPYRLNNLRVEFIAPNRDNALYQYRLNESDSWSQWANEISFTLLNLREGEHTLFIRASVNDNVTETTQFSIHIATPWYRSWYAYSSYLLIAFLIVYIIYLWRNNALKKQREESLIKEKNALRKQSEQYEQEILRMAQERLRSEYDQLKLEMRRKTIDLAKKAKENEDKNRLLLELKERFEAILNNKPGAASDWQEIQKMLDSYLKVEDKTFEIQMDELHQEFFRKLKERFPGLSGNDLRMCAYLRIGLNSKEIADLMNIQPSSAYISRSRLRKKLNLQVDEDLHDFLFNL